MTVRAVSCLLLCLLLVAASPAPLPVVFVDRDNVQITQSCTVRLAAFPIPDRDGNGVVQIHGEGIEVDFGGGRLRGAELDVAPDRYEGIGVTIDGRSNAVRNLAVSGFRIGVNAKGADGLTVEDADLSDNFRQRLRSTTRAEDQADWLWPHENDEQQWLQRYGAALAIRQSDQVTVRRVRVRDGQNGIVLDRVTGSSIYDNDCSFLSGWGLALWRSSGNTICRNAFDFCIRGYSHGVYNRGQDSAGILLFEQCTDNVVAENSATHGGDGLFAFAGAQCAGPGRFATRRGVVPTPWQQRQPLREERLLVRGSARPGAHVQLRQPHSRQPIRRQRDLRDLGRVLERDAHSGQHLRRQRRDGIRSRARGDQHRARPGQPDSGQRLCPQRVRRPLVVGSG